MALSVRDASQGTGTASPFKNTTGNGLTASVGDIIVVCATMDSTSASYPTVSSISDTTANSYVQRNLLQYTSNSGYGSGKTTLAIWWAYAANALVETGTTNQFSVTSAGGALDNGAFVMFSVTGFTGGTYSTNPWDQAAGTAAGFGVTNNGATQTQLISGTNVSTANAAALIFAFGGTSDNSGTLPFVGSYAAGPIAGTTATDSGTAVASETSGTNSAEAAVEYRVLAATISAASAAFATAATAGGWGIMVDALAQAGGSAAAAAPWIPNDMGVFVPRRRIAVPYH